MCINVCSATPYSYPLNLLRHTDCVERDVIYVPLREMFKGLFRDHIFMVYTLCLYKFSSNMSLGTNNIFFWWRDSVEGVVNKVLCKAWRWNEFYYFDDVNLIVSVRGKDTQICPKLSKNIFVNRIEWRIHWFKKYLYVSKIRDEIKF